MNKGKQKENNKIYILVDSPAKHGGWWGKMELDMRRGDNNVYSIYRTVYKQLFVHFTNYLIYIKCFLVMLPLFK